MKRFLLRYPHIDTKTSLGILIFRVSIGLMMLTHGWPKLMNFNERLETFRDPIGLGSAISVSGAVFGEVVCAALIIAGLFTRFSALVLGFVMAVAAFIVHADDPFSSKEKALLFFTSCVLLLFTGPGKYSLDRAVLK